MNKEHVMYTCVNTNNMQGRNDDEMLKDIRDNCANYVNILTGTNTMAQLERGDVEGFDKQPWQDDARFVIAEFRFVTKEEIRQHIIENGPAHEHLKENPSGYSH